jgi:hypothetical protein
MIRWIAIAVAFFSVLALAAALLLEGKLAAPRPAAERPGLTFGPIQRVAPPELKLPLPTLTVRTRGDAGVEVKLRGATTERDCATQGTAEPLCPGEYDVRATRDGTVGLAVVRLVRGEQRELDLELHRAHTLELTVLDDEKLPVDRAVVIAQHPATGYLLRGRSDSDGTLTLGPALSGEWQVLAWRDGWAPAATTVTAGHSATVRLGNLGTVDGTLEPKVNGVRLELTTLERVTVAQATTDGGAFRLGPVPTGKYELAVHDDGLEPHREPVKAPANGLTVRVSTGATLKGDLIGPEHQRLSGLVTLEGPGQTRTVIARDGVFEARALTPGRWRLTSGEGHATVLIEGGTSRVELTVPKYDGVISGSCEFDGGHRFPERVVVRAKSDDGTREASTACDGGRFELAGLPRGFYALEVEADEGRQAWSGPVGAAATGSDEVRVVVPGVALLSWRVVDETGHLLDVTQTREHFDSRDLELELTAPGHVALNRIASLERGRDTNLGDVVLSKGVRISGRVLDAATKDPIPGASVSVGGIEHVTPNDGTFALDEAPEAEVEVTTTHPRYVTDRRGFRAPGELSIELTRAARLKGPLVTVDGTQPGHVVVWANSNGATVVVPVEQGNFVTPHLADGRWLLRVMPLDDSAAVSGFDAVEVEVKGPGDRSVSLVERAAGLNLDVQVNDGEGAPTASDVLLVPRKETAPADEQQFAHLLQRPGLIGDSTQAPGRYRFSHVPPGAYTLLASARGRVWTVAMPVSVEGGMGPVLLSFPQVPYSR